MKKLEFETIKGKFVLVDNNQDDETVIDFLKKVDYGSYMNRIKLSELTEEQASEIVERHTNCKRYFFKKETPQSYYNEAIVCLHSLLKSKGIHLYENPYKYAKTESEEIADKLARCRFITKEETKSHIEEQKTFYNPYIFKL